MEFEDESRYPLQRYLEFVSTNTRNVFGIHIRAMTSSFMIISVCSIWCCNVHWSVPVLIHGEDVSLHDEEFQQTTHQR